MYSAEAALLPGKTQKPATSINDVLQSYQKSVTKLLNQKISRDHSNQLLPLELRHALMESIGSRGKLIRPAIVLLACQAAGGAASTAMSAAVSVELVHHAILIYDDIIDEDRVRRGKPAAHVKYGKNVAMVLAGILISRALNLVSESSKVLLVICKVLEDLGVGEAIELSAQIDGEADYLRMITRKTASLFEASAHIGAILAGADQQQREGLSAYGTNLGIAFQIRDDILGSVGDEKTLGKPVGSDLLNARPNIVSIFLANNLDVTLGDLPRKIKREGLRAIRASLEFRVALEKAESLCRLYEERSRGAVMPIADSRHREYLIQLTRFVVDRVS